MFDRPIDDKAILERAEKAHKHICELAKSGARKWRMTIPVQPDDSDILLGDVCRDVKWLMARLEKSESELRRLKGLNMIYAYTNDASNAFKRGEIPELAEGVEV